MYKKSAIIISKDQKLYRYIEIELLLLGYAVTTAPSYPSADQKRFDILIYDSRSEFQDTNSKSYYAKYNILITSEDVQNPYFYTFDKIVKYPFLLDEFRSILLNTETLPPTNDSGVKNKEKIFFLNQRNSSVIYNNTAIELSEYEMRTLRILCANPGKSVTREELSKALGASAGNIADVYICHLRRKLERPFGIKVIYTIRSSGYMTDYSLI